MSPIVVGWDGGDRGRDALALAAVLTRLRGAKLLVVNAFEAWLPDYPVPIDYERDVRVAAEEELSRIPLELLTGVDFEARTVGSDSPARALHDFAETEDAELVVLGSTHRGALGRVLPGTVADRFLHGAPCPVAIAPAGYASATPGGLRVIEVAFDGSPESHAALLEAADWAVAANGTLRIVAIVERQAYAVFGTGAMVAEDLTDSLRQHMREELDRARNSLPTGLHVETRLVDGVAATELLQEAAQGVDLLVSGSRAYGPVRRVLLGSVSGELACHAPCPLLVVPRGVEVPREVDPPRAAARV